MFIHSGTTLLDLMNQDSTSKSTALDLIASERMNRYIAY